MSVYSSVNYNKNAPGNPYTPNLRGLIRTGYENVDFTGGSNGMDNSWKWGGGINHYFNPSYGNNLKPTNMIEEYQVSRNALQGQGQGNNGIAQGNQKFDFSGNTKFNNIAGAAVTGLQMAAEGIDRVNEAKAINTDVQGIQADDQGMPVYNLGQRAIDIAAISPRGPGAGEILGDTAKGALAGAQVGGGVGAAVGAGIGLVSSLAFGFVRKKKMKDKKRAATRALNTRRGQYNRAYTTASDQRRSMQAYYDSINTEDRLKNLYT